MLSRAFLLSMLSVCSVRCALFCAQWNQMQPMKGGDLLRCCHWIVVVLEAFQHFSQFVDWHGREIFLHWSHYETLPLAWLGCNTVASYSSILVTTAYFFDWRYTHYTELMSRSNVKMLSAGMGWMYYCDRCLWIGFCGEIQTDIYWSLL